MTKIIIFWTALLIAAIISIIYVVGQYVKKYLLKKFPPPGNMVTAKQHKLHVNCQGQGPVTVVLEAGLNDFSLHWNRLQPLLAQHTRTCSYDRAGLGWSEMSSTPRSIQNMVEDLGAVIQSLGENKHMILVGNSYGALIIRLYTQLQPDNVRALVLVDPANEFMSDRLAGYREAIALAANQFKRLQPIASFGLLALSSARIPAGQLEGEALEQYRAVVASGAFFKGAFAESRAMLDNLTTMQKLGRASLPGIPIVIISRGGRSSQNIAGTQKDILDQDVIWAELQADLVYRLNAKHIIAEQNDHRLQLSAPNLVFKTVLSFVNTLKQI